MGTSDCFDRMVIEGNCCNCQLCSFAMGCLRRTVSFPPLQDSVEGIEVGTGHRHWEHIRLGEVVVHP